MPLPSRRRRANTATPSPSVESSESMTSSSGRLSKRGGRRPPLPSPLPPPLPSPSPLRDGCSIRMWTRSELSAAQNGQFAASILNFMPLAGTSTSRSPMVAVVASSKTYTTTERVRSPAASAMMQPDSGSETTSSVRLYVRVMTVALTSGVPKVVFSREMSGREAERLRMEWASMTSPEGVISCTAPNLRCTYSPFSRRPE
mmetsp:Transcript_61963/g.195858  ORF Transcript_61963/g.195858 Transcript_61963/m.195858 type:complete len:201 (+) Transcript_61963:1294-1896(+)